MIARVMTLVSEGEVNNFVVIKVPEDIPIHVLWSPLEKGKILRETKGVLRYKPWPTDDCSLCPGVESNGGWEVILSADHVIFDPNDGIFED